MCLKRTALVLLMTQALDHMNLTQWCEYHLWKEKRGDIFTVQMHFSEICYSVFFLRYWHFTGYLQYEEKCSELAACKVLTLANFQ